MMDRANIATDLTIKGILRTIKSCFTSKSEMETFKSGIEKSVSEQLKQHNDSIVSNLTQENAENAAKAAQSEAHAAASEASAKISEENALMSEAGSRAQAKLAERWAASEESPDGQFDKDSKDGKTQSSKKWAMRAKDEAITAANKAKEMSEYSQDVKNTLQRAQELQVAAQNLHDMIENLKNQADDAILEVKGLRDSISDIVIYRGTVETYADLPTNVLIGWMYNIRVGEPAFNINDGDNVIWNGKDWDNIGSFLNVDKILKADNDASFGKLSAKTIQADTVTANVKGTASRAVIAESAESVEWNRVKNKPEAMPADGGTADRALAADICTGNAASATNATRLVDPTGNSIDIINDFHTENNEDTWIPVFKEGKMQHTEKLKMITGAAKKLSGPVFCKSDDNAETVWFKVAEHTFPGVYHDVNITFMVRNTFADDGSGILIVRARSNESNIWERGNIFWLNHNGMDINDFVLLHNTEAPCHVELWTRIPLQFQGRQFTILGDAYRDYELLNTWTVCESITAPGATSYTVGMEAIVSTLGGAVSVAAELGTPEPRLANATEFNEIAIHNYPNGTFESLAPTGYGLLGITKAIDFDWYDSRWSIGNVRGGNTNSEGFGFGYKANKNAGYNSVAWIDTNGTYHGNVTGTADAATRIAGNNIVGDNYIDFGPNSTWGEVLRIGGNGHTDSTKASVVATNGNLHLDAKKDCDMYLNFYSGKRINFGHGAEVIDSYIENGIYHGSHELPSRSVQWIDARDNAPLRQPVWNDYSPFSSIRAQNGTWDNGAYMDNILHWSFIRDEDYNARNNRQNGDIQFRPDGSIAASGGFHGQLHGSMDGFACSGSDIPRNCNDMACNSITYYLAGGPDPSIGASTTDGALYSQAHSANWVGQIAQDYRNGSLFVRGKNDGSWTPWRRMVWNEGTWNINITGEAQISTRIGGRDDIRYGANDLQYFNIHSTSRGDAHNNGTPADDWYHIIRMNHPNNAGYFVDVAFPFHSWDAAFRRIVGGVDQGWARILNEGNYTQYAAARDGDTIYVNNWFRARGNCGIYWENWGGGWYMEDSTWLRAYNGKNIYTPGTMRCDGEMQCNALRIRDKAGVAVSGWDPSSGTLDLVAY